MESLAENMQTSGVKSMYKYGEHRAIKQMQQEHSLYQVLYNSINNIHSYSIDVTVINMLPYLYAGSQLN